MSIVLYGATGYTGQLVTDELVRRGATFTLSGRNPEKLAALSAERGQGAPWRAVAADDLAGLRDLLADAAVVINCAGPFTLAGDALPAAAAQTGTHYLDSTGEQTFMQQVFERHGAEAERTGAALVPAMGFDYGPGDCLARIVCRDHEPVQDLVMAYAMEGFGMTRGTLRSGLEMVAGATVTYRDGAWVPQDTGVLRASFTFPEPIGRQRMSRYPAGEVVTVPRHSDVRNVTALLTTRSAVPEPATLLMVYGEPLLAAVLKTPLRDVLGNAIGRLPEGPAEADRRAARFTVAAVATGVDGSVTQGVVRGNDVYGLTAVSLVWGALHMAAPGYDRRGPLGPAAAFDPDAYLGDMAPHGITYEVG